jgi:hypothetical protein
VRLDPNLEEAHHELAYLYGASNALDQALEHRQQEARLSRRAGPRPGESADEFAYRLEFLEKDTAKLVEMVEDRRKQYATGSLVFQGNRIAQARLAIRLGLPRKAVEEILFPTPAELLGPAGIRRELELLLSLGRIQEVRDILSDKGVRASKHGLEYSEIPPPLARDRESFYSSPYKWPAYEWLHLLEAAAVGDYAQCREELRALRAVERAEFERTRLQADTFKRRNETLLLPFLLSGPPAFLPAFAALALRQALEERMMLETRERTLLAQQADLAVLQGLLALEQGDTNQARSAFIEAQELGATTPFAGRHIAVGYLGMMKK